MPCALNWFDRDMPSVTWGLKRTKMVSQKGLVKGPFLLKVNVAKATLQKPPGLASKRMIG